MTTMLQESLNAPDTAALIEQVVMHNDLRELSKEQRLQYVRELCRIMGGLNPLTGPFQYITLNGRLTLYVTADGAEQLRKIHGVSITIKSAGSDGDLFLVRVEAHDKTGRIDADLAAVPIGGLRGEALANAMMKCVTKAKRRCTLSLVGLGLLDETEVASIPNAVRTRVDLATGEILEEPTKLDAFAKTLSDPPPPPPAPPSTSPDLFDEEAAPPADTRLERQLALDAIGRHLGRLQLSPPMLSRLLRQHCGVDRLPELDDVTDPAALGALLAELDVLARTRKETQDRTRKISTRPEPNR